MSLSKTRHQIPTWRVFPRVSFFQKRYDGLLPRFKRAIEAFPRSFCDTDLLKSIEKVKMHFQYAFGVVVLSYDTLELSDIVVTLKPWKEENLKETQYPAVLTVFICYIKIDQVNDLSWKKVSSTIDFFYNEYGRSDLKLFESLFIVVDIVLPTPSSTEEFRDKISNKVQSLCPEWSCKDRIIINAESSPLCNKLSEWLEVKVINGFHYVLYYLDAYIRHERPLSCSDDNLLQLIDRRNIISNFLQNDFLIEEIKQCALMDDSAEVAGRNVGDKFLHHLTSRIAHVVKCSMVSLAADKYNLVPWQVNLLFHELNFQQNILDSISMNTRYYLKKLNDVKSHDQSKQRKQPYDQISHSLVNDMWKSVSDVEKKLKNMDIVVTLIGKMIFEIEGYLSATITEVYVSKSVAPTVPDGLRKEILRLNDVLGVGTVYNKLEIHVQPNSSEVRDNIAELIRKHKFSSQYIVKYVNQKIQSLSDNLYDNGVPIKCLSTGPNENANYHTGTLGCFTYNEDKKLYALTAAHVVSNPNFESLEILACDEAKKYSKLGKSKRSLAVFTGQEPLPLVDIAAIKINDDVAHYCVKQLKDETGLYQSSFVATETQNELLKMFVFKYGAATDLTCGIICSTDFATVGNNDYIVMIENLPVDGEPFAVQGDSGSIICSPDIDTGKIKLISMLTGGDYQVDGDFMPRYITFLLKHGLKQLSAKCGYSFNFV